MKHLFGIRYPNNSTEVIFSNRENERQLLNDIRLNGKRCKDFTKAKTKSTSMQFMHNVTEFRIKLLDTTKRKLKFIDSVAYEVVEGFFTGRKIIKEGNKFIVYSQNDDVLYYNTNSRKSKDFLLNL